MAVADRPFPYYPWSPGEVEELVDSERKVLLTGLRKIREDLSRK